MNLSPESLQAFAQAAELGSFSAAARKLGKSQSTISEAISRLEIDLNVSLFDRSSRQPVLTEAGQALLGRVADVLAASDRLGRMAQLLAGGVEPRLTLVLSDTYQSVQYEARLKELDAHYPDIEFECLLAEQSDVLDLVGSGRAALGLLAAQPAYPPDIGSATVPGCVEFGLFVARSHPLASFPRVDLETLRAWRLLHLNPLTGSARQDSPALLAGSRIWSGTTYWLVLDMAVQGLGWAELPRWLVEAYAPGRMVELAVPGWPCSLAVDVVWSRQHSLGPAGNWLMSRLLERET